MNSHDIKKLDPSTLTPEQTEEGRAKREQLMAWLFTLPMGDACKSRQLLSRQSSDFPWEATGFHIDPTEELVYAKVGKHPYQPIGQITQDIFVPLLGSQLLWRREFAMADVRPFTSAFKVEDLPALPTDKPTDEALTDHEREVMSTQMEDMQNALAEFKRISGNEPPLPGVDDPQDTLLDSLKLTCIRLRRVERMLDARARQFKHENPNQGDLLEVAVKNRTLSAVVSGTIEWMDMKLQDDKLRRDIESSIMVVPEEDRGKKLKSVLLEKLTAAIQAKDDKAMGHAVDACYVSCAPLREKILKMRELGTSTIDAVEILKTELES